MYLFTSYLNKFLLIISSNINENKSLFALRFLIVLLQVLSLKLYTNYLSLNDIGLFYVFISLILLINSIFFNPIDYFNQSKLLLEIKLYKNINSLIYINAKILIIYFFIILLILLINSIANYLSNIYLLMILTGVILFSLNSTLKNNLNILENKYYFSKAILIESILKLIFFVFFLNFSNELNSNILILSWIIANLILFFILAKKISNYINIYIKEFNNFDIKEVLKFSIPISYSSIINWINSQSYILIYTYMGFIELIGIVTTLLNIGSSSSSPIASFYAQYNSPKLYKSNGDSLYKIINYALILGIFLIFIYSILGNFIVHLLTNENFEKYWYLIIIGLLIEIINLINGFFSSYISMSLKNKLFIFGSTFGLIFFSIIIIFFLALNLINIYVIAITIIIPQLSIVCYYYYVLKKSKTD